MRSASSGHRSTIEDVGAFEAVILLKVEPRLLAAEFVAQMCQSQIPSGRTRQEEEKTMVIRLDIGCGPTHGGKRPRCYREQKDGQDTNAKHNRAEKPDASLREHCSI